MGGGANRTISKVKQPKSTTARIECHGGSHHCHPESKNDQIGRFEMPKFEMPKFDMPKVEMPAAFREFAERGVAQAKDTYEKMKAAAEEATDVLESTYSTATKGASDYGLKVIEAARTNTNAAFDFAGEIMAAKTLSEVVELTSAHARKQFEALTAQSKELSALAQKVATETAEPIKSRHEQGLQQGQLSAALIYAAHSCGEAEARVSDPGFCFLCSARPLAACQSLAKSGHSS